MSIQLHKIIAIVGLTASGKSDLALQVAKKVGGELIAADSRTVYRGMDIGTAKTKDILGVDLVDPDEAFTVADFKTYAEQKIGEILDRGSIPILVGGTGLYIQAVIDNFGFDQTKGEAKYDALQIGIDVDREELYKRIDARVDKMIELGLVEEVRALRDKYGCDVKSMTGIGYRQVCQYLNGEIDLDEAIRLIKRDTRHYAKRQWTWFKRDDRIVWVKGVEEALKHIRTFFNQETPA